MQCNRCGKETPEEDIVPMQGRSLCEDCAMSVLSPAKACDPWAVKAATSGFATRADAVATLQGVEKALYELVTTKGRLPSEAAPSHLNVTEEEARRAFTVLRHMELLKGSRRADGGADYVPFTA